MGTGTKNTPYNEAARIHYKWCPGCSEYKGHTVEVPIKDCLGNCSELIHDDPACPKSGKIKEIHVCESPDHYDC